jgi:hypothetical protein
MGRARAKAEKDGNNVCRCDPFTGQEVVMAIASENSLIAAGLMTKGANK